MRYTIATDRNISYDFERELIRDDEYTSIETEVNNYQINNKKKDGQKSVNYNFEERSLVETKMANNGLRNNHN